MRQIFQDLKTGQIQVKDIPFPKTKNGFVTINTQNTLVSIGTERMLVEFGKAGWIEKARSQPEKVKMVLDKVKADGLFATVDAVKSKLDQPMQLGYCNVGVVVEPSNTGFALNARVVSNGNHAEVVRVPKNLVAEIPSEVDNETASFTVLASIAMQGIRLINPTIGETVVVTGLGLIGLLATQILKANGCKVIGIDFDAEKCALARQFGAEVVDLSKGDSPIEIADKVTKSRGVDAVLITASSSSNDIVSQAATMCRKRGRIVLVGVVGLELNRSEFYEKELTFQVSCSYGPGRYDSDYEEAGNDYPFGFVRWTEQRNFEAVLGLMADGAINVKPLISHRFDVDDASAAYDKLDDKSSLGIILNYTDQKSNLYNSEKVVLNSQAHSEPSSCRISFVGAGNYASRVLIPSFKACDVQFSSLITSGGVSGVHFGKKFGFNQASTDLNDAFDENTDLVVIATQHNMHADQTIMALKNGKHVFVEKPLALTYKELEKIELAQKESKKLIMVGYNRRFAPQVQKMKALLSKKTSPKTFIMTMNAGDIPKEHWTQDPKLGGGRIIGEACHYIDLMRYLAGSKILSFSAICMGQSEYISVKEDKAIITLRFEDGSIGSIHYYANGGKVFPKERIEVFCEDAVLQLDNFRKLVGYGWKGFSKMNLWQQDKGQANCCSAFVTAIKEGKACPIPLDEVFEVAKVSIEIAEALRLQD